MRHRKWSEIKQERAESTEWERLLKVVAKMSMFDLLEHMDAAGSEMARAVKDYRTDQNDVTRLLEIDVRLRELQAVNDELKLRFEAAHED
jgi:hypothetical protein